MRSLVAVALLLTACGGSEKEPNADNRLTATGPLEGGWTTPKCGAFLWELTLTPKEPRKCPASPLLPEQLPTNKRGRLDKSTRPDFDAEYFEVDGQTGASSAVPCQYVIQTYDSTRAFNRLVTVKDGVLSGEAVYSVEGQDGGSACEDHFTITGKTIPPN